MCNVRRRRASRSLFNVVGRVVGVAVAVAVHAYILFRGLLVLYNDEDTRDSQYSEHSYYVIV